MDEETKQAFRELQRYIESGFTEMRQENAATREENAAAHAETRQYVDERFEHFEKRFEKRLEESVAEMRLHFDVTIERLDRRFDAGNETMRIFDEAMTERIDETDGRVDALEDDVTDLRTRVGRFDKPH